MRLTVSRPSPVTVRELAVDPDPVTPGESVVVTVVVENNATAPANGVVELIGDGTLRASERVRLDVGEQTTLSFSVRFETPGIRTLRAQDQRVAVTVRDPTVTAANGSLPVLLPVLAVLFALVLARRREQR